MDPHRDRQFDHVPLCGSCRFFVVTTLAKQVGSNEGECRRHAPVANTNAHDFRRRIYPVVSPMETCGDYERAE